MATGWGSKGIVSETYWAKELHCSGIDSDECACAVAGGGGDRRARDFFELGQRVALQCIKDRLIISSVVMQAGKSANVFNSSHVAVNSWLHGAILLPRYLAGELRETATPRLAWYCLVRHHQDVLAERTLAMSTCTAPAVSLFAAKTLREPLLVPMPSALWVLLTDVTTYETLATAVATASYGAFRANDVLFKSRDASGQRSAPSLSEQLIDENARVLEGSMALAFPIIATVSIIFLFFFLGSIGVVLTALSTVSGFFSVLFLLWPLGESLVRRLRTVGVRVRSAAAVECAIVAPLTVAVIGVWLFTGHWLPNNFIGVGLCVLFASLCKVPSLKVTTMLFAGLFAYDIFFVFFSERFFGRNVMVEVATSTPTNPASAIADFLHLPVNPVKTLALPAKLIFPAEGGHHSILGLGDIILPEVLLVYLLEVDLRNRSAPLYHGYFCRALLAYSFGLFASFYFSFAFQAAQPALLYIVPAMIFPTVLLARSRGQLGQIWTGASRSGDADSGSDSSRASDGSGSLLTKDQEDSALLA